MLRLRSAQLERMGAAVRRQFERRMAERLVRSFPAAREALGDAGLAAAIHAGVDRAASYGIVRESDVALYLHLAIALGPDFDRELDWAREILTDPGLPEGARRIQRLYRVATERTSPQGDH